MGLQLHIEELILHGFTNVDRQRIGAAVEQELTRLFTERGIPATIVSGGAVARLDGGSFAVTADAKPQQIGAQVARAIYKGLAQ